MDRSNSSSNTAIAEVKHISDGLERLEDKRLAQQRYAPSREKSDDLSKLALGAKVERALGRRMTGQDAVMKQRHGLGTLTEKDAEKRAAATAGA